MSNSVFAEARFWITVLVSVVLPCCIYGVLHARRAISRSTLLLLGVSLILIATLDVYVLQRLAAQSLATLSTVDDAVFASELSVALYLLPALFGGLGINVISHVLTSHLPETRSKSRPAAPRNAALDPGAEEA